MRKNQLWTTSAALLLIVSLFVMGCKTDEAPAAPETLESVQAAFEYEITDAESYLASLPMGVATDFGEGFHFITSAEQLAFQDAIDAAKTALIIADTITAVNNARTDLATARGTLLTAYNDNVGTLTGDAATAAAARAALLVEIQKQQLFIATLEESSADPADVEAGIKYVTTAQLSTFNTAISNAIVIWTTSSQAAIVYDGAKTVLLLARSTIDGEIKIGTNTSSIPTPNGTYTVDARGDTPTDDFHISLSADNNTIEVQFSGAVQSYTSTAPNFTDVRNLLLNLKANDTFDMNANHLTTVTLKTVPASPAATITGLLDAADIGVTLDYATPALGGVTVEAGKTLTIDAARVPGLTGTLTIEAGATVTAGSLSGGGGEIDGPGTLTVNVGTASAFNSTLLALSSGTIVNGPVVIDLKGNVPIITETHAYLSPGGGGTGTITIQDTKDTKSVNSAGLFVEHDNVVLQGLKFVITDYTKLPFADFDTERYMIVYSGGSKTKVSGLDISFTQNLTSVLADSLVEIDGIYVNGATGEEFVISNNTVVLNPTGLHDTQFTNGIITGNADETTGTGNAVTATLGYDYASLTNTTTIPKLGSFTKVEAGQFWKQGQYRLAYTSSIISGAISDFGTGAAHALSDTIAALQDGTEFDTFISGLTADLIITEDYGFVEKWGYTSGNITSDSSYWFKDGTTGWTPISDGADATP
ncbi:hypothetical protein AGMMS49587_07290 [Spirochaetia bacterium]|nr:hypothetical protein AGMMS49587_07290 [Spirochaetia bacterium]